MQQKPLRIAWVGFHEEGELALPALLDHGYHLVGVITLEEEALKKRSGATDYEEMLRGYGVPLHFVKNINDPDAVALLASMDLDLCFVIGWSQIVRDEALSKVRIGMIGAHASLLPSLRGSAPINWALIRGLRETGNSLIWFVPDVDAGAVIDQTAFEITPYDTCATLYRKVAESNRDMILRLLPKLAAGERPGVPQQETGEELLPRRRPKDGLIDWRQSAGDVYNLIRAVARPYPGAFSFFGGQKAYVWTAALLEGVHTQSEPGTVIGAVRSPAKEACGQIVACGDGALLLLEVQLGESDPMLGPALSDQNWQGKRFTDEA
jgi:methionyl-tRNA formyltransferase